MWKEIKGKPNYEVNAEGQIRNKKTGRILKVSKRKDGYCQVMLGRKTVPVYIHRIVANAFIDNPDNLPQVDHINGNKSDNRVENLRWLTVAENNVGFGHHKRRMARWKPVRATNEATNKILNFKSRQSAADYFKCSATKIKYNYTYKKGNKKDWYFELVEDIV